MSKGEKGAAREIVDGIGIGLLFSVFLSLYISNFTDVILPVWLVYGILAPLISAIAIASIIFSNKDKRQRYAVRYWEETQRREREKERSM